MKDEKPQERRERYFARTGQDEIAEILKSPPGSYAEKVDELAEAWADLRDRLLDVMTPMLVAVMKAARPVYSAFYDAYLEAGAPYGETHEGFVEWLSKLEPESDDGAD